MIRIFFAPALFLLMMSCSNNKQADNVKFIHLLTLDPGHFHAALVQKNMYPTVDSVVNVYAPQGSDVQLHLDRIKAYNTRPENRRTGKKKCIPVMIFLKRC